LKRPNILRSRELRKNQTDAERKLWSLLRDRRLGGIKFRRQFPIDKYILDFYAPELQLAVEADGGQHYEHEGAARDAERETVLSAQGMQIIRFSNTDILQNREGVYEVILRTIERRQKTPSPQSSPLGERR
jgi:adenine-specific DNA-methyltransferase